MSTRLKSAKSAFCLVLCSSFLVLTGCGEDEIPTSPTPEPVIVTDTFSGTINRNGAATHQFTTTSGGALTATVTSLAPDDLVIGFAVGLWNGSVCDLTRGLVRDEAVESTVIYGTVNASGELCVRIYDVGRIGESADYEITVTHP